MQNKTIWFLWLQGEEAMPPLIRACRDSWRRLNPEWDFRFLNESDVADILDLNAVLPTRYRRNISAQYLSDVIRFLLLRDYGGVWVDASSYCNKPLDEWIDEHMAAGFFAFSQPQHQLMLSTWFLASEKGGELIENYCRSIQPYWKSSAKKLFAPKSTIVRQLLKWSGFNRLMRNYPGLWFSFLITRVFRVYPYFCHHYFFAKKYREDSGFKQLWDRIPMVSARAGFRLFEKGLLNPLTDELRQEIESRSVPVYKLSWKAGYETAGPESIYGYLVRAQKV